jgi:signal transduction histidine kinase
MNHEQSAKLGIKGTAWSANVARQTSASIGWLGRHGLERERNLRIEERSRERARITHELHDTLFQGFLGASMLLHNAVEQMPADSPSRSSLSRALQVVHRALEEGRAALRGLHSTRAASTSLEQALSDFADEFTSAGRARFRIFALGQPRTLKPTIRDQVYLIAREALVNALRHSEATSVEVEVEYLSNKLRLVVRDNGTGFDPQALRSARSPRWGLQGMRERARSIGAQLRIWSRRGAGTEVEICVEGIVAAKADIPKFSACNRDSAFESPVHLVGLQPSMNAE